MAEIAGNTARLQELEVRTYHIDSEVSGLKAQLSSQGNQLNRIENMLLAPKDGPNYSAWAGVVVTILFGLGAMFVGISSYVDLQLNHVKGDIANVSLLVHESREKEATLAYSSGLRRAESAVHKERLDHYDELYHLMDDRLRVVEEKAAAAKVSRKAIGDYSKELGAKLP